MALSSWQVNLSPGTGCFDIFQLSRLHWPGRDAFWGWMRGWYMRIFASTLSITCSECCQWLPTACRIQFFVPYIAGISSFLLPCVFHVRPPSFNPDTLLFWFPLEAPQLMPLVFSRMWFSGFSSLTCILTISESPCPVCLFQEPPTPNIVDQASSHPPILHLLIILEHFYFYRYG